MGMRFPGGMVECPKCKTERKRHRVSGRTAYACDHCGHHMCLLIGTIFEKSTTSLRLWFYAVHLMGPLAAESPQSGSSDGWSDLHDRVAGLSPDPEASRMTRIKHKANVYGMGDSHTCSVDAPWSLTKRGIGGVYQAVSAKYLQYYLDE